MRLIFKSLDALQNVGVTHLIRLDGQNIDFSPEGSSSRKQLQA